MESDETALFTGAEVKHIQGGPQWKSTGKCSREERETEAKDAGRMEKKSKGRKFLEETVGGRTHWDPC